MALKRFATGNSGRRLALFLQNTVDESRGAVIPGSGAWTPTKTPKSFDTPRRLLGSNCAQRSVLARKVTVLQAQSEASYTWDRGRPESAEAEQLSDYCKEDASESIFGGPKFNTVVVFVPQMQQWIVERFGKFSRILDAGLNFIIPLAERIARTISLKEIAKRIPSQPVITADNVMLDIDGILYFKVNDPYKACYGVKNPDYAIEQIAMTTMRSEIGKITLDNLFRERENLNTQIVDSLSIAVDPWGVQIMRYEIRDIRLPSGVQRAMVMIVEAERKKRAAILESEGRKKAEINIAEGQRAARILSSEADKQEEINRAHGDAAAVIARAEAHAKSLEILASRLSSQTGINAAALQVAENYVKAFRKLAKETNTMIIPNNPDDVTTAVAKAMTIYKRFAQHTDETPTLSGDRSGNRGIAGNDTGDEGRKGGG